MAKDGLERKANKRKSCSKNIRHDAFSIRGREPDFWAGVIAADGCVQGDRTLRLGFKSGDRRFLEEWRSWIGSEHKISRLTRKLNGRAHEAVQLCVSSMQLVQDLNKNYNITPRKSLTLKPPGDITYEYLSGLFYGDGYVSRITDTSWAIGWCGSREVINAVQDVFSDLSRARAGRYTISEACKIVYRGRFNTEKIARIILENSPFEMDRKSELLRQIVNNARTGRITHPDVMKEIIDRLVAGEPRKQIAKDLGVKLCVVHSAYARNKIGKKHT